MSEAHKNPNAKIGFVIYYPFQFYVYKNVYKHLFDDAEFIIDLGPFFPRKQQSEDAVSSIVKLLQKHNVRYRILYFDDYYSASYLRAFFSQYDILVSVWLFGCMWLQHHPRLKKVHMTYGAGKELITFDLRKYIYDLILAYGEYDHAFYSQITDSIIVGNPKFDEWFSGTLDREGVAHIEAQLDAQKKTVLYLPTHSDLSSIAELSDKLKELCNTYNVIAKLHYLTSTEEPELVERLEGSRIIILKDDADLLSLLNIADVILSDNSSAIFDAILAEKPVIVTDFHAPEYFAAEHWRSRTYRRGKTGPLTYPGSIEQRTKHDGTVDIITSPEQLQAMIEKILQTDEKKMRRDKLKETLFLKSDGQAGKRAADAILELQKRESMPEKPFLHYALRFYASNIWRQANESRVSRFHLRIAQIKRSFRNLFSKKK